MSAPVAIDEAGDRHIVSDAIADQILAGEEVFMPIAGDDFSVRLVSLMGPLQSITETPWDDNEDTAEYGDDERTV